MPSYRCPRCNKTDVAFTEEDGWGMCPDCGYHGYKDQQFERTDKVRKYNEKDLWRSPYQNGDGRPDPEAKK